MGFFSKLTEGVASMALGEQAKPDPACVAYAESRGWQYLHSESALVVGHVLKTVTKEGMRNAYEQSQQMNDPAASPTGVFGAEVEPMPEGDVYPFTESHTSDNEDKVNMRRCFFGLTEHGLPFSAGTASWKQKHHTGNGSETEMVEHRSWVVSVAIPDVNLPPIQLSPESAASRATGGIMGDIKTEYHDFNHAWQVLAGDRETALTLLDPRLQEMLMGEPYLGMHVGFQGARVYLANSQQPIRSSRVTDLMQGKIGVGGSAAAGFGFQEDDWFLPPEDIDAWISAVLGVASLIPQILKTSAQTAPLAEKPSFDRPHRPQRKN